MCSCQMWKDVSTSEKKETKWPQLLLEFWSVSVNVTGLGRGGVAYYIGQANDTFA